MGLMVKRVKGHLYVYEYIRLSRNRYVVKYIGSLEEIVRTYQAFKAGLIVNQANRVFKRSQLKQLAEMIVDNFLQKQGEEYINMVRRPGFEPGVSGLGGRRPSPG